MLSPKTLWIKKEILTEALDVLENFHTLNYFASEIKVTPLQQNELMAQLIYHLTLNKKTAVVDKFSTINLNFWKDLQFLEEDSFEVYSSMYINNKVLTPPYSVKNNTPSLPWYCIKWLWKHVFIESISSLKNKIFFI